MSDLTAVPSANVREVTSLTNADDMLISSGGTTARVSAPVMSSYVANVVLALQNQVVAIPGSLVPAGGWDPTTGNFPSGSAVGTYYVVTDTGTVDGQLFAPGDWLIPIFDNASTSTYDANWVQGEYGQGVARLDAQATLAQAVTKYGVVPSLPSAPVYLDDELDLAIAQAVAAGEAVLYFLPGLHFFQRPIVVPGGISLVGLGNVTNVRFGTADPIFDEVVDAENTTTFVFCGTGSKDYSVPYTTKGLQLGFRHTNTGIRNYTSAQDQFFELLDFTNQDASGATPATPKMFSAAIRLEESFQKHKISNIRVLPSCPDPSAGEVQGVGGYKRNDTVLPVADWDVGVFASAPWGIEMKDMCIVGYWRMASHLSFHAYVDPGSSGTPNSEHGSYDHCVFQPGPALRGTDTWPIIDKTSTQIFVRWTASHEFDPAGGTLRLTTTDTIAGAQNYTYTGITYVAGNTPNYGANTVTTGWLRFDGVTPAAGGSPDTSAIQTEHANPGSCGKIVPLFAGGHSHTKFTHCIMTDLSHSSGLDEASPSMRGAGLPGRDNYSTALEISGAPMRALDFYNCTFSTTGPRTIHVGTADDMTFISCYAETRPYRTVLGGSLTGVRGGVFLAGSIAALRQETGNAASFDGANFGDDWNDVIGMHPERLTRVGSRMEGMTDHFYAYDEFVNYALLFPGTTSNQLLMRGKLGQEVRIVRQAADGTDSNLLYARTVSGVDRIELVDNTLHITDQTAIRPGVDGVVDNGQASFMWNDTFSNKFRPGNGAPIWTSGAGSPEGAVSAPIGSLYTRTDGGTNTTLYIKESGASTTGWVAK